MKAILFTSAATAFLCACSQSAPDGGQSSTANLANSAISVPIEPANEAPLPEASPQEVVFADFERRIESGLSCDFSITGDKPIFVASTADDPAVRNKGVIKLDGRISVLTADRPGDHQSLFAGQGFSGDEIVDITRAKGEGELHGTESTRWRATMTMMRVPSRADRIEGWWTCGA